MMVRVTDMGDGKMGDEKIPEVRSSDTSHPPAPAIAVEELALDVFESATPDVRNRMLTELVSKVYDSPPLPERRRIRERLLLPLRVLSLVPVATGIVDQLRFRGWCHHCQLRICASPSLRP